MLDDLRGAAAFVNGRERLFLNSSGGAGSKVAFIDDLALWSISEDIIRLLSASSGLDDVITLELGQINGSTLRVGRYAATLNVEDGYVSVVNELDVDNAEAIRSLEWFSIIRPKTRVIARQTWTERLSRRGETLPDELEGPGLVLLRQDGRVVGRPTLAVGRSQLEKGDLSPLQLAGLLARPAARAEAMVVALQRMVWRTEAAAKDRTYLLELVTALDGIPPSALDVLRFLSRDAGALAILLAAAIDENQRAAVWRLERDLPFMWALVPVEAWATAFSNHAQQLENLVADRGVDRASAAGIALAAMDRAAEGITDLDPILRMPLSFVGKAAPLATAPSALLESAQDRIRRTADLADEQPRRRTIDLIDPASASMFRRHGSEVAPLLPDLSRFDASQWEGLDAACAAAISASGQALPPPNQILRIRAARAEEPLSFADMYAEALRLLAHNKPLSC